MKLILPLALLLFFLIVGILLLSLHKKAATSSAPAASIPVASFNPNPTTPIPPFPAFSVSPSTSPSFSPSPASSSASAIAPLTRDQLIAMTPIQTEQFNIEYYRDLDKINVTIKESPYDQNKALAEEWFRERGFTDLNTLGVVWSSYPYVK